MTDQELASLERASFNSFDPEGFSDFDPDGFDSMRGKNRQGAQGTKVMSGKVGKLQAQFDIIITSDCPNNQTKVELFNNFKSQSGAYNGQVSQLRVVDIPAIVAAINLADDGTDASTAGNALLVDKIYFDSNGSLVHKDTSNGGGTVTVSCRQVPYLSLLKSSAIQPFNCEKIRMTVTSDGQIDNEITHVTNTFLGAQRRNAISPRSFFRPDQFQGLIIDIPSSFKIDGEKGLEYIMNNKGALPAQVVTFNMFLSRYVKQQIN